MRIQDLTNSPISGGSRPEPRQSGGSGPSFREQLAETALSSGGEPAKAASPTLYDAQTAMLEKLKRGKEQKEEEEAWNELMEYIDAWIAALRGEGDPEKSARAYGALKARESESPAKREEPEDVLLRVLTERLCL